MTPQLISQYELAYGTASQVVEDCTHDNSFSKIYHWDHPPDIRINTYLHIFG